MAYKRAHSQSFTIFRYAASVPSVGLKRRIVNVSLGRAQSALLHVQCMNKV